MTDDDVNDINDPDDEDEDARRQRALEAVFEGVTALFPGHRVFMLIAPHPEEIGFIFNGDPAEVADLLVRSLREVMTKLESKRTEKPAA